MTPYTYSLFRITPTIYLGYLPEFHSGRIYSGLDKSGLNDEALNVTLYQQVVAGIQQHIKDCIDEKLERKVYVKFESLHPNELFRTKVAYVGS